MKKIIAMALSLAMLLTIVGCRSNTSNDSPNTSPNNTNVTQNDTTDSEGVSGGSKVTGKEIGVIIAGLETYYSYWGCRRKPAEWSANCYPLFLYNSIRCR